MKYNLKTYSKKLLADTITAVSVNLSKHDNFPNSLLVENSDYHSNHYSFHYICSNPIAYITIEKEISKQNFQMYNSWKKETELEFIPSQEHINISEMMNKMQY